MRRRAAQAVLEVAQGELGPLRAAVLQHELRRERRRLLLRNGFGGRFGGHGLVECHRRALHRRVFESLRGQLGGHFDGGRTRTGGLPGKRSPALEAELGSRRIQRATVRAGFSGGQGGPQHRRGRGCARRSGRRPPRWRRARGGHRQDGFAEVGPAGRGLRHAGRSERRWRSRLDGDAAARRHGQARLGGLLVGDGECAQLLRERLRNLGGRSECVRGRLVQRRLPGRRRGEELEPAVGADAHPRLVVGLAPAADLAQRLGQLHRLGGGLLPAQRRPAPLALGGDVFVLLAARRTDDHRVHEHTSRPAHGSIRGQQRPNPVVARRVEAR